MCHSDEDVRTPAYTVTARSKCDGTRKNPIALFHTLYWQTLHGDIHEYYTDPQSGLKRANFLSMESPYTRWVVENHVGHHVLRGKGNYNIVFPGPDYLWGTCFVNSEANTRR